MREEEYNNIENRDVMMTIYLNLTDRIIGALSKGLDCTTTNIFICLLSDTVVIKLSEYTTE